MGNLGFTPCSVLNITNYRAQGLKCGIRDLSGINYMQNHLSSYYLSLNFTSSSKTPTLKYCIEVLYSEHKLPIAFTFREKFTSQGWGGTRLKLGIYLKWQIITCLVTSFWRSQRNHVLQKFFLSFLKVEIDGKMALGVHSFMEMVLELWWWAVGVKSDLHQFVQDCKPQNYQKGVQNIICLSLNQRQYGTFSNK